MKNLFLSVLVVLFSLSANAANYTLFGTSPAGATDLTSAVSAQALGSTTLVDGVFTGAGLPGRICQSDHYLQLSVAEAQSMSLTDQMALHIVLQRTAAGTGNVQVALCNAGWNAARAGWTIDGSAISETESEVILLFEDRNTGDWNSYSEANLYGTDRAFTGEILRLCTAAGESFAIKSIYVESSYTPAGEPTEIPDQDAQRIYIRRGTANTPSGVLETADYSEGLSLYSEYWNCTIASDFFGVTTNWPADGDWENGWWFNFQVKSNAKVDLSQVFATWSLVMSVKNQVVEQGTDRGLSVKINGKELTFVTTYAEAEAFTEHVMPLSSVLSGAAHLKAINPGATIMDLSSTNDHTGGRNVEIDYIYLTNESSVVTSLPSTEVSEATKVLLNGRVLIQRDGHLFTLTGQRID